MEIVVLGAGSLGSLVGGMLAREHTVTLVGREPHMRAIRTRGLRVSGAIGMAVHPSASTTPPGDADLAVVTVKAYDTRTAARDLAGTTLDAVLSLQNGMGNEATLTAELDCPVLAGTCTYGAVLDEPGKVTCTGVGEVVLGPRQGGELPVADHVGTAFEAADIETLIAADMPFRLWEKLAVNAGINATTALARVQNSAILEPPANAVAEAAASEVARVARSDGVGLDDDHAITAVEQVAEDTAANTSSMYQDVLAGRRTEIDAINGYVVDRARSNGVAVPVNETLAGLVRAWECNAKGKE